MVRILIADDHAIVRKGVKQLILEEYPSATFGEAGDAEELIIKVITGQWDLVICDLNMPGRSGLDALNQIKKTTPALPVLIMSMHPEEQYALRALKGKASGYLNKDTIHLDLVKAVNSVLGGRRYITQSIAEKLANAFEVGDKELHENLSTRELEVLLLLVSGLTSSEIAKKLTISANTVSTYRNRVLEKLQMKSNAELVRYALEKKLI